MARRWRRFKRRYRAHAAAIVLILAGVLLGVMVAGGPR